MNTKTIGNKYPCCRKPTGLHHDHWDDDAVLVKSCPRCGTEYVITFERVQPFRGLGEFRKLHFRKTKDHDERADKATR